MEKVTSQSNSVLEYEIENQQIIVFKKKGKTVEVWDICLEFNRQTLAI